MEDNSHKNKKDNNPVKKAVRNSEINLDDAVYIDEKINYNELKKVPFYLEAKIFNKL